LQGEEKNEEEKPFFIVYAGTRNEMRGDSRFLGSLPAVAHPAHVQAASFPLLFSCAPISELD